MIKNATLLFKTGWAASAVCVLLLAAAPPAFAESAAALVEKGNRAFAEDRLDEAMGAYEKALEKKPDSAQILYNKGCVLYRKGDFPAAADMFEKAAVYGSDDVFDARIQFNLGNSMFKAGQSGQSDPDAGLSAVERSITHYEKAIDLDPGLDAAARNLEIARMARQQLEEALKQQQKQDHEQKERQEQTKEALEDLIDRQESLARESEEAESKDAQSQRDAGGKLAEEQEKLQADTRELSRKMSSDDSADQQKSMEAARQKLEDAAGRQAGAKDDLEQSQFTEAREQQEAAAEELKKALSELEKNSKDSPSQQGSPSGKTDPPRPSEDAPPDGNESAEKQGQPPSQAAAPGSEDPEKILQEEQRHRQEARSVEGGWHPVDKDW